MFPYERPFIIEKTSDQTRYLKMTNLFTLPADLQIQVVFLYYAPKNIPQGHQYARTSLDFGIKKGCMNDKGEIIFSFNDIFNRYGIKQKLVEKEFEAFYENYYDTQVVRMGFKYKF